MKFARPWLALVVYWIALSPDLYDALAKVVAFVGLAAIENVVAVGAGVAATNAAFWLYHAGVSPVMSTTSPATRLCGADVV